MRPASRVNGPAQGGAARQPKIGCSKTRFASSMPADDGPPVALSIAEAAKMLGISRSLAYELAARGELRTVRLGRRIVVPRIVVIELLDAA